MTELGRESRTGHCNLAVMPESVLIELWNPGEQHGRRRARLSERYTERVMWEDLRVRAEMP